MVRKQETSLSIASATCHGLIGTILISLTACSGIPVRAKNGTTHYLIIGLGVVSVREQTGVSVVSVAAGGLTASQGAIRIGVGRQHEVQIAPEQAGNTVISVGATPLGLTVTNFDTHVGGRGAEPTQPKEEGER